MTSIIKLRDPALASVRTLPLTGAVPPPAEPPEPAVDPELAGLRLQTGALAQQVRHRDAEIEQLKHDVAAAFSDGQAQGREAGEAAADARMGERLMVLEASVTRAVELFAQEMVGLEQLAVALAHAGLAKVLEAPEAQADLVAGAIRLHLQRLERQSVLSVLVSRADFPEPADLERLAAAVGRPDLQVAAGDDLPSGCCRLGLRLGALEVGVRQQWSRLSEALQALADPGPMA